MRSLIFLLFFFRTTLIYSQSDSNHILKFNGSSGYVDLGSTVSNGIRSIEFWFRNDIVISSTTSAPGFSFIVRNDPSENSEFGVYIRGTDWSSDVGKLCFFVRYAGVLHEIKTNQNLWSPNSWFHVAAVIDNITGMRLYINGILQNDTDPSANSPVPIDSHITTLGSWGDSLTRFFNGRMDEISLWDRGITELEIKNRKCIDLVPLSETDLKAYWKCEENNNFLIYDSTANNNSGVINGLVHILEEFCNRDLPLPVINNGPVIPNVLSINNDGINDSFIIKDLESGSQLKIYNRWGTQIFSSDNYQNNWMPSDVSSGTYYYLLTSKTGTIYKGFIEILK